MSPDAREPVAPAPVTPPRVHAALKRQGYAVKRVSPTVVSGAWDGNAFTIAIVGDHTDVLQVRGTWHRVIPLGLAANLARAINDWNRDRIWPKVFTRTSPDGIEAHAEVCLDLSAGVTDDQLAEAIACGLGTGVQFFEALDRLIEP